MSNHALPDDIRQWPSNPAELLGVPEDADRKTLRRAYSKLVRRYKPEHASEEFQAIRSAYDSLLQICEWREHFGAEIQAESGESEIVDSAGDVTTPANEPPSEWSESAFASTNHQIDELWQSAKAGQLESAYREYVNLLQSNPGNEEIAIRLYWLCKIAPQLDTRWDPVHWLFEAMHRGSVTPRLLTLYGNELSETPNLVTTSRAEKLLSLPLPEGLLYQLAMQHLQATATIKNWSAMQNCLDQLRPRLLGAGSETWIRLLMTTLDEIAFSHDHAAVQLEQQIRDELEQNEHLQLSMGYAFDRAELLRIVNEESGHEDVPRQLDKLLAVSWNSEPAEYQLLLLEFLKPWIVDPDRGLQQLDSLTKNCAVVLGRLMELLEYAAQGGPEFDQSEGSVEQLKRRLRRLLASQRWPNYEDLRVPIRDFCLDEGIPLNVVEYMLASDPEFFFLTENDYRAVHEISEDIALACLIRAFHAFWHVESS